MKVVQDTATMAHKTKEIHEVLGSIILININKVMGGAVINNARIKDSLKNSFILIPVPAVQRVLRLFSLTNLLINYSYLLVFQVSRETSMNKKL